MDVAGWRLTKTVDPGISSKIESNQGSSSRIQANIEGRKKLYIIIQTKLGRVCCRE